MKKNKFSNENVTIIQPTRSYHSLFYNNCEWLIDIIGGIAKELKNIEGKVINNKICLDNVYRMQQKDIRISDWGSSSMRNVSGVSQQSIVTYHESILFDSSDWLMHP